MRVLVDTNIFASKCPTESPAGFAVYTCSSKLIRQQDSVFFCPQNIAEFWNVATRPTAMNGLGLSHDEAIREVESIEMLLTLLPDIPAIYGTWKEIVSSHRVQGVRVYDGRLVAVARVYRIENILTFNTADFKRYASVTTLHPSTVLAEIR